MEVLNQKDIVESQSSSVRLCLCGCGSEVFKDSHGRGGKYVRGHCMRGRILSEAVKVKQRAGWKAAWLADPNKFEWLRNQTAEHRGKISAALKGKKKPSGYGEMIRVRFLGKKLTPSHAEKNKAHGWGTPANKRTPEQEKKRRKGISISRTGTHGCGRGKRDRPDHCRALHWIIRDNRGVIHEFDNLQSWARANEYRFLPDDRPKSKLPLWLRAVSGFNGMQRIDRKGLHQWKGWTLVSVLERQEKGAPDLLARDVPCIQPKLPGSGLEGGR